MDILYAVAGVGLVLLVVVDALWTTLWVDGAAGPLTRNWTTLSWRALLKTVGRRHHKALSVFGPTILAATVVLWVVLILAGWVLLYSYEPDALRSTGDDSPADLTGRIWFVAYSMFTVGNGDFAPREGSWQVVSSIVSGSGMVLITLIVSYVLSVLSAVVGKRAFAGQVSGLGSSAEQLVISGWNGRDLQSLDRQLDSFSSQLGQLSEQYQSYPVLQYYHAAQAAKSPVKAVGILDDALTLMRFGVAADSRPATATLTSARSSVGSFLDALRQGMVSPTHEGPPRPTLDALRREGIPTVSDAEFERAVDDLLERRRTLHGVVRSDGWNWEE